jgi:hypothetical protein
MADADDRVERSLYNRAIGYSYDAVKIFCDKNGKVTRVPCREHVPPDVTACIFWLKNRNPAKWRDVQNVEHVLGKYIISDKPMTEEEWIRERATDIANKMASICRTRPSPRAWGRSPITPSSTSRRQIR